MVTSPSGRLYLLLENGVLLVLTGGSTMGTTMDTNIQHQPMPTVDMKHRISLDEVTSHTAVPRPIVSATVPPVHDPHPTKCPAEPSVTWMCWWWNIALTNSVNHNCSQLIEPSYRCHR